MRTREENQKIIDVSWEEFDRMADKLAGLIREEEIKKGKRYIGIYAIPRGGYVLGTALSHRLGIPMCHIFHQPDIIIVDEICDAGKTLNYHMKHNPDEEECLTVVWHQRKGSLYEPDIVGEVLEHREWMRYPWERWTKKE